MAGNLSLELPHLPVDVENAMAEKSGESALQEISLLVDIESSFEYVLDDCWICSDDANSSKRALNGDGAGRRLLNQFRRPLGPPFPVLHKL